jgi:surface antigen
MFIQFKLEVLIKMLKDFFASSPVVVGSLLIVSTLISGCNTTTGGYYGELSTNTAYNKPNSVFDIVANASKHSAYSVPREDREKHEQCVYFALDNMDLGESCDWYSPGANGQVQVVSHSPISNGFCTTLFHTVSYKGRLKNWQETACKTGARQQWVFAGK